MFRETITIKFDAWHMLLRLVSIFTRLFTHAFHWDSIIIIKVRVSSCVVIAYYSTLMSSKFKGYDFRDDEHCDIMIW